MRGARSLAGVAMGMAVLAGAWWALARGAGAPTPGDETPAEPGVGAPGAAAPRLAGRERAGSGAAPSAGGDDVPAARSQTFTGRVVTEQRTAIAGARVRAAPTFDLAAAFRDDLPEARTDAEGRFRLTAWFSPKAHIASAEGFASRQWGLRAPTAPVDIVLPRAYGKIVGTVRDSTGNPVAGARVLAGETWKAFDATTSAADGSFSLVRPVAEWAESRVTAWAAGFAGAYEKDVPAPDASGVSRIDLVLGAGMEIVGRVVDDATGAGIAGASVGTWDLGDPVRTDADGGFRIIQEEPRLQATAPGYEPGEGTVSLATPPPRVLEIRLVPHVAYEGTTVDERGAALAGATVVALAGGRTTSDADGRFRVPAPRMRAAGDRVCLVAILGERTPGVAVVEQGQAREGIVLALRAGAPVVGRVVDGSGAPRPEAVLRLSTTGGPTWSRGLDPLLALLGENDGSWPATVDARGEFRVAGLPEGTYRIAAWPNADALWYVEASARVSPEGPREEIVIVVDGATLRGVVVDSAGVPVPGASISARLEGRDVMSSESDGNGRFELVGVSDRPFRLDVQRRGYEGWQGEVDPQDVEVRVVLRPMHRLAVRVALEVASGPPVESVALRLVPKNGSSAHFTGSYPVVDGAVEIEWVVLPGAYELRVEGPTHMGGPIAVEVPSGGGEVSVRLRLSPAPAVAGVVLGPDGAPVAGAALRFWQFEPLRTPVEGKTDERGHFRFGGLVPGTGRVDVNHPGHLAVLRQVAVGREDVTIRLIARIEVSGTVVFAEPSEDRSRWQVLLVPVVPPEDGSVPGFSIAEDGTFRGEVGPGAYRGYASRGPVHGAPVAFTAKAGTPIRDLRLEAPRTGGLAIAGRVLSPTGLPERSAYVAVRSAGPGQRPGGTGHTDEDGRFEVAELEPGTYRVDVAASSGQASVQGVAAGTRTLEIRLLAHGQVRGTVRDRSGAGLDGLQVRASGAGFEGRSGVVEPDGRYAFDQVPAGAYRIHARAGSRVAVSDPVEVRSGEVRRGVDIDLVQGGAIEGTVRDAAGKPVAGAWVQARHDGAPGPGSAATDAEGAFRLEGLAAGTWRVSVGHDRLGAVLRTVVEVRLGRTEHLDLAPE